MHFRRRNKCDGRVFSFIVYPNHDVVGTVWLFNCKKNVAGEVPKSDGNYVFSSTPFVALGNTPRIFAPGDSDFRMAGFSFNLLKL